MTQTTHPTSRRRVLRLAGLLLAVLLFAAACENDPDGAVQDDQETAQRQLDRFQDAQPVPEYAWSQVRQNLIEISTAQAQTTVTTSFFFNLGVATPISSCPSIGFPIPSTHQLTNPDQVITRSNSRITTVAQVESIGVYTGDSTGTYVVCTDPNGQAYALYWEGFVSTVTGPAVWNADAGQIELVGDPTFDFSEGQN